MDQFKYRIGRRLVRPLSSFLRFYHYDVLRGFSFLLNWSHALKRQLPLEAIEECIEYIDGNFPDGRMRVQRAAWSGASSRWLNPSTVSWTKVPAASYPLLEGVSEVGIESPYLTKSWTDVRLNLLAAIEEEMIETAN